MPSAQHCQGLGTFWPLLEAQTHPVSCPTGRSWIPWLKEDAKPWALLFEVVYFK